MHINLKELESILTQTQNNYELDLFVETGTWKGDTLNAVHPLFNNLISIEISDELFKSSSARFEKNSKIKILKGDSSIVLTSVLNSNQNQNILFFLDGHFSAGDTGKGDIDVPLETELKCIMKEYNKPCLIIVDDAHLFEYKDELVDWSYINEEKILQVTSKRLKNYFYVTPPFKPELKRLILEIE